MKIRRNNSSLWILVLVVVLVLNSCTERFRPELTDFENNLVIDGKITNEPGPYTIRLSFSSDLDLVKYTPVKGAKVTILEEGGASENLIELAEGEYRTSEMGIRGEVGKSYKLRIEIGDNLYESDYQLLKAPTPIANVYAEIESKFFTEDNADVLGYQFYVDSEDPVNDQDYFLWIADATFKYRAEYAVEFIYAGTTLPFANPDSLRTCWRRDTVNKVTTYNTSAYADPSVRQVPLYFVKSNDLALSVRYSTLVKQYTISKEAFEFWQGIEAQLNLDAALYTTQPYQTRGNVKNMNNTEETVLGFFLVAGVSEKRIFVDAPASLPLYQPNCFYDYEGYGFRRAEPAILYPIYVAQGTDGRAFAPPGCLDCRDNGGSIVKPSYWID